MKFCFRLIGRRSSVALVTADTYKSHSDFAAACKGDSQLFLDVILHIEIGPSRPVQPLRNFCLLPSPGPRLSVTVAPLGAVAADRVLVATVGLLLAWQVWRGNE